MDWTILYDEAVLGDLKKIGQGDRLRIKKYLDKLHAECAHPSERGEPYRHELKGFWKYRVGNYRVICTIEDGALTVLCVMMVAHRSESYGTKNIRELFSRGEELEERIKEMMKDGIK
ncbi:MAG: type II toxin-antitoxin system RelE/ParE family toxin [Rickettsiales bacterium]